MNIVDAYGNRWDREEWLAIGQSAQAWETIVRLTGAMQKIVDAWDAGDAYLTADAINEARPLLPTWR